MSNEGTASIKITGDVRDFARQTERDLNRALARIRVDPIKVPIDEAEVRRDGETLGQEFASGMGRGAERQIDADRGRLGKAGEKLGDAVGKGVKRGTDRESKGAFSSLRSSLDKVGDVIGKALSGAGGALASTAGAIGTTVGIAFIAGLVAVVVPALAAAITSGLGLGLGAGLIGVGALFLKDTAKMKAALKDFKKEFKEISQEAAKPLLKPLIKSLDDILKITKDLKLGDLFKGLAPSIRPLTAALGGFLKGIVGGLKDSLPGITAAFAGLARVLPVVGKWIGDFFRTIFANDKLIDNTTEGLMKLIFGPLKLLGPLISGLNVLFGVWNNLIPLTGMIIDRLFTALARFVDGGSGMLARITEAWGPLGEAIQNVWDKIKLFAGEDALANLPQRFDDVVAAIKEAWGPLKDFLGVIWDEAIAAIKRIWEEEFIPWWNETAMPWLRKAVRIAFEMAWNAAVNIVNQKISRIISDTQMQLNRLPGIIISALASVPGIIGSIFARAHNTAVRWVMGLVIRVVSEFRNLVRQIGRALAGVHNTVINAFAGAGSWLIQAGVTIVNGLVQGIRNGFDRVRGVLGELTAMLPNWKGPAEVDRMILRRSGRLVMQGFESGLRDQIGSVRSTLTAVTSGLPSAVSSGRSSAAATASLSGATFNIYVSGATGESAGKRAAEVVLERLAQAGLVRG